MSKITNYNTFFDPKKIPKLSFNSDKIPTEENFIQDYFKDIDNNPNITKIFKKYENVKNTFVNDVSKIPKEYIDEKDKGNIKMQSSPGWEYVVKETENFHRTKYSYNVSSQSVTSVGDKLFKEFVFSKQECVTLFMITLEITMQKMAYEILKDDPKVTVPEIKNHYLINLEDQGEYKIIIEMDFIEHNILDQKNVSTAIYALKKLQENDIFHFDTHKHNIVQSKDANKVVILDFGKAQITKIPDIRSTTGLYEVNDEVYKQDADGKQILVTFDYQKWASGTDPELKWNKNINFYGGKKNKSKRKTKKGKKKKGKSKKRTYRKRK
jgi:serine/threonine protein kinase